MIKRHSPGWFLLFLVFATGCQLFAPLARERVEKRAPGTAIARILHEEEPTLRQPGLDEMASLQRTFVTLDDGQGSLLTHVQGALVSDYPSHATIMTLGDFRYRRGVMVVLNDWRELFLSIGYDEKKAGEDIEFNAEQMTKQHPIEPGKEYFFQLVLDEEYFRTRLIDKSNQLRYSNVRLHNALFNSLVAHRLFLLDKPNKTSIPNASEIFPIIGLRRVSKEGITEEVYFSLVCIYSTYDVPGYMTNTMVRLTKTIIQPDDEIMLLTYEQLEELLKARYGAERGKRQQR